MINYKKFKLSNGLNAIFAPMEQTGAVTVLLLVKTGSRYETKSEGGISHFLEHMFFKGTTNRPTAQIIANELDSIGASYNAFTGEEYTGFYVRCSNKKIENAIDILSDMLINSTFEDKEIKKEKGVIIEEINMYEDLPQKQIVDITKNHFFGDTPLGRSTLGTKESVSSFTKKDFDNYKNVHYSAHNSVLVIAGGGDIEVWKRMAEEKFGKFNKNNVKIEEKASIKNETSVCLKYKQTDQAHITFGFEIFPRNDNRRYALKLINNVLGETMSSRLFTEVREKRGLAYYVGSDTWYFSDTGVLIAYAGVDHKRVNEAVKVIKDQLLGLSIDKISGAELQKAKDNVEGKIYLGLENSLAVSEYLAEQELLYNKIETPEEVIDKLKKVTLDDLNEVLSDLKNNKMKLTAIGPFKQKEKFLKIIE